MPCKIKYLVIPVLLLLLAGCSHGLSRSRPAYPPNCPFTDERECRTWFFGN